MAHRRAGSNAVILLQSSDEEDEHEARMTHESGRHPRSTAKQGGPSRNLRSQTKASSSRPEAPKRPTTSKQGQITSKKRHEGPREDSDIECVSSPSLFTRSRKPLLSVEAGANVSRKQLTVAERCLGEIEKLKLNYGEDDEGFGVKVSQKRGELETSVVLCVAPLMDSRLRSYTLTLIRTSGPPTHRRSLKHLPPIRVRLEFSTNVAKCLLSCSWLHKSHTKKLSAKMNRAFKQHVGNEPFTAALSWLEKEGMKESGIANSRNITYVMTAVVKKQPQWLEFEELNHIEQLFMNAQARQEAVSRIPALKSALSFDCPICFDHKSILKIMVFPGCLHFFCQDCLRQDFSLKIHENRVKDLLCLAEECSAPMHPDAIKSLISVDEFKRYCDLTADVAVEGPSFLRCPKKQCSAPMELPADAAREVSCPTCKHKFCSTCKGKPHRGKPCLTDAQKRDIREQYEKANAKDKKVLEDKYGVNNIKFALEDAESEDWIAKNAKPCPKCKTPIQKSDGCNKMVCTAKACHAYFCWLCGADLTHQANPYLHFQSGPCSGRLHEGQQGIGINQPPGLNLPPADQLWQYFQNHPVEEFGSDSEDDSAEDDLGDDDDDDPSSNDSDDEMGPLMFPYFYGHGHPHYELPDLGGPFMDWAGHDFLDSSDDDDDDMMALLALDLL